MTSLLIAATTSHVLSSIASIAVTIFILGVLLLGTILRFAHDNAREKERRRLAIDGRKLRDRELISQPEASVVVEAFPAGLLANRNEGCQKSDGTGNLTIEDLINLGRSHHGLGSVPTRWKCHSVRGDAIERFQVGTVSVFCCQCAPKLVDEVQSLDFPSRFAVTVSCTYTGLASSFFHKLCASGMDCLFVGWRTREFWDGAVRVSEAHAAKRLAEFTCIDRPG